MSLLNAERVTVNDALLQVCHCGRPTVHSGHAVVYDPFARHWTFLVWPVRPGTIEIYGVPNVMGCPVCLAPASAKEALDYTHLPGECRDHLVHLHQNEAKPVIVTLGEQKEQGPMKLPEPQEV